MAGMFRGRACRQRSRGSAIALAALAVAALVLVPSSRAIAHDVPLDATVHAFVKPEGNVLRLLIRVPLKGLADAINVTVFRARSIVMPR